MRNVNIMHIMAKEKVQVGQEIINLDVFNRADILAEKGKIVEILEPQGHYVKRADYCAVIEFENGRVDICAGLDRYPAIKEIKYQEVQKQKGLMKFFGKGKIENELIQVDMFPEGEKVDNYIIFDDNEEKLYFGDLVKYVKGCDKLNGLPPIYEK